MNIYQQIWEHAKVYYVKGRPMDVSHIEWMMDQVKHLCRIEHLDETLLMPLAILHDVGYSALKDPATANHYNTDIRKAHMEAGAKIAEKILHEVMYPKDKLQQVVHYVSIHDAWALGEVDIYVKDKILGTFKDLDYLWIYTKDGCAPIQKVLKKNNKEMLEHLKNETSPIYNKKPFSTNYAKNLREKYLKEREEELT